MSDQQTKGAGKLRSSLDGAGRAWQKLTSQPDQATIKKPYATVADGAKSAFTVLVGGFAPFCVMVILTISAGYYFNSLRPFTGDVQSIIAYGTALIVEVVNLALFFVSAKAFWSGQRAHFVTALLVGLLLTAVSVVAQVLYLSNNLDQASISSGAAILQLVPLFGPLANTGTIIVSRALALHVGEFACCYVIARSAVSHRKIIQAQQEQQEAQIALMESEQFMAFKQALHSAQMAQLEHMRGLLAGGRVVEGEGAAPALLPFRADGAGAANNGHKKS